MKKTLNAASLLSAALVLTLASSAGAQIANGGFESGSFAGWTYAGNTGSSAAQFVLARDPLNGGSQAPVSGEWAPSGGGYFAALWSTDSAGSSTATLSQSFTATANASIEFDVFFDFGDWAPSTDGATITLSWLGGSATLAQFNTSAGNQLADDTNVDWTHVSFALPSAGSYTLEFHIADTDGAFESILGIDNVVLTPAPSTGALLGVLLVFAGRRRRI